MFFKLAEESAGKKGSVLMTIGMAVLLLCSGATRADPVVAAGYDLFLTQPGTFFTPPPPLSPTPAISLEGLPLSHFDFVAEQAGCNPQGADCEFVGDTDTIVRRDMDAVVAMFPGTATIMIEMVALHLKSVTPFMGGDFLYVTLQTERTATEQTALGPGMPSTGTMDIMFVDNSGGQFASEIEVRFDVRLGNVDDPVTMNPIVASGLKILQATAESWDRDPLPGAILIADVNHLLDGSTTAQDFFPDPVSETPPMATAPPPQDPNLHVARTATVTTETERWDFAGTAEGGEVSATINGCTVTIATVAGQSRSEVAANFADAVNADACLDPQGVRASASGNAVTITGPQVNVTNTTITDPGLRHNPIPTLGEWGLILLALLLLTGGAILIRRRKQSAA